MKARGLIIFIVLVIFFVLADARRTCYGNVANLSPTRRSSGGISASEREVRWNLRELEKRKSIYQEVADQNCIQASLIAAIASRESNGGSSLINGYGDYDQAWGIMQCDLNHNSDLNCKSCGAYTKCHIQMMVFKVLIPAIKQVKNKFLSWSQDKTLQGGVAAYNFGVDDVWTWDNLDVGTTDNDYTNDVIAHAKYLHARGWN